MKVKLLFDAEEGATHGVVGVQWQVKLWGVGGWQNDRGGARTKALLRLRAPTWAFCQPGPAPLLHVHLHIGPAVHSFFIYSVKSKITGFFHFPLDKSQGLC
jgi:hypothetical protein